MHLKEKRVICDMAVNDKTQDDLAALKNFLLDIDCLAPLNEWTRGFNLFDILRITRTEIRHSNLLSWLMTPNENHGLGDDVLKGFIQFVVAAALDTNDPTIFSTLLMDCHDFTIQREWRNIDILAVSTEHKFVLAVENKIDSTEHDDQLNRYKTIIEATYPDYQHLLIYLSPQGDAASDPDNWCAMSYQDVLDIVERAKAKTKLLPEAELLIDNYIQTVRRDIVGDENLAKICAEIYAKHQRALDLIFEHKPDRASLLAAVFIAWAKKKTEAGEIELVPDKCGKSYTRFKTATMSKILPDSETAESGWGTPNYYFYEICNGGEFFILHLSLSSNNIPDDLMQVCDEINKHYPSKVQKENWKWRTPYSGRKIHVDEDMSEEKIFHQLDKELEKIKEFEQDLIAKLG